MSYSAICLDKTGTLTYGKPQVIYIKSLNNIYSENDILEYTAIAESRSEHPLGKAIIEKYNKEIIRKKVFLILN